MTEAESTHRAALAAFEAGRGEEAIRLMARSVELAPQNAPFAANFGLVCRLLGRIDEAIAHWRRAIAIDANCLDALINLSAALFERGLADESLHHAQCAMRLAPNRPEAHLNIAAAMVGLRRFDDAVKTLRAMLERFPNHPDALANLGNALKNAGRINDAIDAWRRCVRAHPKHAQAWNNLGAACEDCGLPSEATAAFRAAINAEPRFAPAHSNLVYAMHFDPRQTPASILDENRNWDRRHGEPLRAQWPQHHNRHDNDRNPDRRLRIGYLSPHLRDHPVGRAMLPLLEHHHAAAFEIICYSTTTRPDDFTARLRQSAHVWNDVSTSTDVQIAERILSDRIDILIDLAQHMAHNRMAVVARKPAPIIASFIGYPATTGVAAIDYRITDALLDPVGATEQFNSEKLIRLPRSFYCYRGENVPLGTSPVATNDHITFGCLNSPFKVSDDCIALWSQVLSAVPNSRLRVAAPAALDDDLIARYVHNGIPRERLDLQPRVPLLEYFRAYDHIDIALDTIPYNGGVTTCDALWMGVPVISMRGETSVARIGESILTSLSAPQWLASSRDEFVQIASTLATNPLPSRTELRDQMLKSPLCDETGFTRAVESAYRQMWHNWCTPR